MEFSTSAAQQGAVQEQSFHSRASMFKPKGPGCRSLDIYLPLVHFTSSLISGGKLSPGFLENPTAVSVYWLTSNCKGNMPLNSRQAPRRGSSPETSSKTSWSPRLSPEARGAPTAWCPWGCASSTCQKYLSPSSIPRAGLCPSQMHWSPRRTL